MTLVYIQGRTYRNDRGCWTFITLLVSFNSIYRGRVVQYHTWLITLKTGANPWLRNQFSDVLVRTSGTVTLILES
jgi:hypothetical protein